jgi:DNA recombination protein RmuC
VLAKVQKKLQEASNQIESAEKRSRAIGRTLKSVQTLPESEAPDVLQIEAVEEEAETGP